MAWLKKTELQQETLKSDFLKDFRAVRHLTDFFQCQQEIDRGRSALEAGVTYMATSHLPEQLDFGLRRTNLTDIRDPSSDPSSEITLLSVLEGEKAKTNK